MITLSRNTFRIAEMVRAELPESLLIAGGPLPTLYPQRYSQQFDAVFRGEVDLSFPQFCRDFFEQRGTSPNTAGAAARNLRRALHPRSRACWWIIPRSIIRKRKSRAFPSQTEAISITQPIRRYGWRMTGQRPPPSCYPGMSIQLRFLLETGFWQLFRHRDLDMVFEEIEANPPPGL